jgi:hypothetical protein
LPTNSEAADLTITDRFGQPPQVIPVALNQGGIYLVGDQIFQRWVLPGTLESEQAPIRKVTDTRRKPQPQQDPWARNREKPTWYLIASVAHL